MINFLAQAQNLPSSEVVGIWGGGLGAVLLYLFGPALREKLPGAKIYSGPMRPGDSEKLHEVHKVVTVQDGEHYLALFPRREMAELHSEQNQRIAKIAEIQAEIMKSEERIATSLSEVSKTMLEVATILRTRG